MTPPRRALGPHTGWRLRALREINSSGNLYGNPYSLGMQKSAEIRATIVDFDPNGTIRRREWLGRGWQRHGFRANSGDKVREVGGELECRGDG